MNEESENKKNQESKIVDFPIHRATLSKMKNRIKPGNKVSFELEQKKVLISASFFSIVLAVVVANFDLRANSVSQSGDGRGIASVTGLQQNYDFKWQNEIAKELAVEKSRPGSKRGQKPSLLDEMTFGELGGAYMLEMSAGKVSRIEVNNSSSNYANMKVFNPEGFINSYAAFFPKFDKVKGPDKRSPSNEKLAYKLFRDGKAQGVVYIQLNSEGYLQTLSVEN